MHLSNRYDGHWQSGIKAERALQSEKTPIISLRRPNCAQMFFIYPGLRVGLDDEGVSFLSMIRDAGLGNRNLALIADPYGENYTRGVGATIPDLASLVLWHKNLLRDLPHVTEFYHLGHSSGGYGALLFGHLLGAKKVWALAPRSARIRNAEPAKAFLKKTLLGGNGITEHVIHYSLSNERDCAFADYFADCSGIVLSPYEVPHPNRPMGADAPAINEGYYHRELLRRILSSGDLQKLLPPFRPAG